MSKRKKDDFSTGNAELDEVVANLRRIAANPKGGIAQITALKELAKIYEKYAPPPEKKVVHDFALFPLMRKDDGKVSPIDGADPLIIKGIA